MNRERLEEITKEARAAHPLPERVGDLDQLSRRAAERAAERLGVSPQQYLDKARAGIESTAADAALAEQVADTIRRNR